MPSDPPAAPGAGEQAALASGVLARDRRALAKAITLIESTRTDHRRQAQVLLEALLPRTGESLRAGISGAPGVGKSTFIEALGLYLLEQGRRVAVLAVDPSSSVSGGSILGDKTRMERLSIAENAYIRPSPTAGSLGGVAARTREAMLVCEAAGHDVILVETVGVGQSETAVAEMVDVFVLLQMPHAGDDLQAIKKGIVELADIVAINKSDLDPAAAASARRQWENALAMLHPSSPGWRTPVIEVSAAKAAGIDAFWRQVEAYRHAMTQSGEWADKRRRQAVDWMWNLIESGLREGFREHPGVRAEMQRLTEAVGDGRVAPSAAAQALLALARKKRR
jgi:LAO/AO transport system kinase